MSDFDQTRMLSRRQCVGLLSVPLAAAVLSSVPAVAAAAEPNNAGPANDLGTRTYNIRDFGAKGDGTTLDTAAVQAAIDACTKDQGGVVLVPAGVFVIGTIELKSNVTLRIASQGKLLGSGDGKQYHAADEIPLSGDSTLGDGNWGLIYAVNSTNITIEGPGTIDGNGKQFFPPQRGALPPAGLHGNQRPYLLLFYRCRNLAIRNIDLFESGYHAVRVIQTQYAHMDGLHIHNRVTHNNDGFHFISCQYVTVSNCNVESQDDACALFGSCKFITVTNCTFSTRWSVFRFGGGVAENVAVSNCVMHQVYGCPIKIHCPPGSRMENMSFSNLIMTDVTGPIDISVGPTQRRASTRPSSRPAAESDEPIKRDPGVVRNIAFSNIHGTVTTNPQPLADVLFNSTYNSGEKHSCITINSVGDSVVENVSFNDIHLTFGGGGTAEDAARRDLPHYSGEYFMLGPMPAYGFYARNSRGITLQNIRFQVASPDLRPALILDHVEDVAVNGLSVQGNADAESVVRIINTKQTLLSATRLLTPASVFLRVEGNDSANILIDGGDLTQAAKPLDFAAGAESGAVKLRT